MWCPKDHWTLQWKGLNLYSKGPQKASFDGMGQDTSGRKDFSYHNFRSKELGTVSVSKIRQNARICTIKYYKVGPGSSSKWSYNP